MDILKKNCILFLLSFLFGISISGCYYDVAEELYPSTAECDTTQVTFAIDINPLLQQKCLSCHSQASNQGGVNLEGYDQVKSFADNGKLSGSISYASGFSPMPKGESQLSSCSINKVKAWINNGAPNN